MDTVREFWLDKYKGKYSIACVMSNAVSKVPPLKERAFTSIRNHKHLKISHCFTEPITPTIDLYNEFIETDIIELTEDKVFNAIKYWNDYYHMQPDLTWMALDALAVPVMSDEYKWLFSSAKLLLTDRHSWLRLDIIEASKYLQAWYEHPKCNTFDDEDIGLMEGELPAV